MSFRNDKKAVSEWANWKKLNFQKLTEIGIPAVIFDKEIRWLNFIEEAYDFEIEWGPSFLSIEVLPALITFLENEYEKGDANVLVNELKNVLEN